MLEEFSLKARSRVASGQAASDHCEVRWLLQTCVEENEAFSTLQNNSYLHSNGFLKLVLWRDERDGSAVRLHFWPPDCENTYGDLHNHRWNFWSTIISGELQYEEYEKSHSGDPYFHYRYHGSRSELSQMEHIGEQRLVRIKHGSRIAGEHYYVSNDQLHVTYGTLDKPTITLVVQSPNKREHADVYCTGLLNKSTTVSRLTEAEFASYLQKCIHCLN